MFVLSEETTFEAGVKVQIHSQSEPPFIQELGFGVAPGFQTFVATQEQRVSFLGYLDQWSSAYANYLQRGEEEKMRCPLLAGCESAQKFGTELADLLQQCYCTTC